MTNGHKPLTEAELKELILERLEGIIGKYQSLHIQFERTKADYQTTKLFYESLGGMAPPLVLQGKKPQVPHSELEASIEQVWISMGKPQPGKPGQGSHYLADMKASLKAIGYDHLPVDSTIYSIMKKIRDRHKQEEE